MLNVQAAMLLLKLLDQIPFVGRGIVQQNNERAAQVTQQFAQKVTDLFLADVVIEEQVIKIQPMPRAERNSGDDTDLVAPP